jgi:CheY-like chemotaxis protein
MSELQTVASQNTRPTPVAAVASLADIAQPLVLIAAADPASRQDRVLHFERRGYRVAIARTPFATSVKASWHLPDLIVVDGSLGEADANHTTELLSTCPATAHIPIVRL